jgi:hypothetical protein
MSREPRRNVLEQLTFGQFFQSALRCLSRFKGLMSYLRRASMRVRLDRSRHSAVTSGFEPKWNRSQFDVETVGYHLRACPAIDFCLMSVTKIFSWCALR